MGKLLFCFKMGTLVAGTALGLAGCSGSLTGSSAKSRSQSQSQSQIPSPFPLSISSNKKYLVDAQGSPFLIRGDVAWSAAVQLSQAQFASYLDDRKSRGFNAVLFNLIEHNFSSQSPKWNNKNGVAPFSNLNDFTTVNEAYFAHVDALIRLAYDRGMLALIAPSYLGYNCGTEGWCVPMRGNGATKLNQYGQYVGQRYKDFPNIIWVEGGDHTPSSSGSPSDMDLVNAVATGIKTGDQGKHLHTAHWDSETSAAEIAGLSWLDLDATYSYTAPHLYVKALSDFSRDDGVRPFFLFEARYENETGSTAVKTRAQIYQPVLSGGSGFLFGNFPVWQFWTPTDASWSYDMGGYPSGWTTALASPGAASVTAASSLLGGISWQDLRPDTGHSFVTSGYGTSGSDTYALAAKSADGRLGVVYMTARMTITVSFASMTGTASTARWMDPSTGSFTAVSGSPFLNSGTQNLTPPAGSHSDGAADWILLVESN